jgi:hypothetical protein
MARVANVSNQCTGSYFDTNRDDMIVQVPVAGCPSVSVIDDDRDCAVRLRASYLDRARVRGHDSGTTPPVTEIDPLVKM